MTLVGNWETKSAGDQMIVRGRNSIIGRNGAVLEVSVDGNNWEEVHTFPPSTGEVYEFEVPTDTHIRMTGGGQWAISKFNVMSG